jgi:hypothetical protein
MRPGVCYGAHGRSLQAEIHDVLQRASTRNLAETGRVSAHWLKRLRKTSQSDSSVMAVVLAKNFHKAKLQRDEWCLMAFHSSLQLRQGLRPWPE